ncbi:uncharacterized protein LOC117168262 [Belonocnema kinseyi]|uniref:uncharacterized protein LOC117168262 n=1 Tax=Belonocnema kinseyi TaxID=2817044 RepID=UPI00143D63D1|nr:uncharacterized protein LOC117168262 [Belonocnema kinseyi]
MYFFLSKFGRKPCPSPKYHFVRIHAGALGNGSIKGKNGKRKPLVPATLLTVISFESLIMELSSNSLPRGVMAGAHRTQPPSVLCIEESTKNSTAVLSQTASSLWIEGAHRTQPPSVFSWSIKSSAGTVSSSAWPAGPPNTPSGRQVPIGRNLLPGDRAISIEDTSPRDRTPQ